MRGLGDIIKQAESMQRSMEAMQEEMRGARVTGESGGGMVKVTVNGKHEALKVEIDPALGDERSLLADLVASAITDAARRVEALQKEKLASLVRSMGLPPGFMPPF